MYHLTKILNWKLLKTEAPLCLFSLFMAESFYKFHSFTLELIAFGGTWYFLSYTVTHLFYSDKQR
jgi:hypothetical protein